MNINLHIESLVLDGVDIASGQSDLLRASVTNQLAQMLNYGGLASDIFAGVSLNRVTTNSILLSDRKTRVLGQQIATSVYGGITHE